MTAQPKQAVSEQVGSAALPGRQSSKIARGCPHLSTSSDIQANFEGPPDIL